MTNQIPCMLMRGGTSKGAYFLREDLPIDAVKRDELLLSIMGSPDARQVDGIGGAHPLTSKVAIISKSDMLDFLFAQVSVTEPKVDVTPNCGNILAGVLPFAIERGLIKAGDKTTTALVRTLNTGTIAEITVETPNGRVSYEGITKIDGVLKPSAPVKINFLDAEGSVCGKLLPTGNVKDILAGVEVTMIDNGMPVLIMKAEAFGITGFETYQALDKNLELKAKIEKVRLKAGFKMNLGDVSKKVIPKICLVSKPLHGNINTRSFIPHECHSSIGVFAAVTVATAACLVGSVAHEVAKLPNGNEKLISVEHPTGEFTVNLTLENGRVVKAGLLRTARKLFDGKVFPHE